MNYMKGHGTRTTPQSEPIRSDQIENSAGGFVWGVPPEVRLRRFLILGSEGGSYYASERKLTAGNVSALAECIKKDGIGTVKTILEVSTKGLAPKNDQAIFALAYCVAEGDDATKQLALGSLPAVCRTATHLFMFAEFLDKSFGKLTGRAKRRALANWYLSKSPEKAAYQMVKYRNREGWTHRDILRLSHPGTKVSSGNPESEVSEHQATLFAWCVGKEVDPEALPRIVQGFEAIQKEPGIGEAIKLIEEYKLPRECVPTAYLTDPGIWEALLNTDMPITAMIRNLGNMTSVGLLTPTSQATRTVIRKLEDQEAITGSKIHPMQLLIAQRTYASGGGYRSSKTWPAVAQIVDVLDSAFYAAFGNVPTTGKRFLLALDVSGSMAGGQVAGAPITPREAAAAMALVTANAEPLYETVGFFAGDGGLVGGSGTTHRYGMYGAQNGITPLPISPKQRLADVVKIINRADFGGTDCSLPMLYAANLRREVDTFIVYTDSETWAGGMHPTQALQEYRRASGLNSKLVVVGMVSNGFTIADPNDEGMLDVVGFDASTPAIISGFANGEV